MTRSKTRADRAQGKAQRKKELQKNKETRKRAREFATAKQDTSPLEDEIEATEAKPNLTGEDKDRLRYLRSELTRIKKAKEDYLKEHPEHRAIVYASARKRNKEGAQASGPADRNLFGKDGLPLRPERSIYYDPVMNPYGVPPPGMPYMERPPTPGPIQENSSSDSEEGLDIPLPSGRPPGDAGSSDEEEDASLPHDALPPGFIPPLPQGPPPPNAILAPGFAPSAPPTGGLIGVSQPPPPPPPGSPPPQAMYPHPGYPVPPPPPPPPAGVSQPMVGHPGLPPIPLNMPSASASASLPPGAIPPPPFGFPNFAPNFPLPPSSQQPPHASRVPNQHFDPLAPPSVSVQPAQPPSSLPKRPPPPSSNKLALDDNSSAATVMAAPELRDLKKEATAFLPRGLRQKAIAKDSAGVNAAPTAGDPGPGPQEPSRPDLMASLTKAGLAGKTPTAGTAEQDTAEEYDRLMADIGDLA